MINDLLATYKPITLDEMQGIKLMNRTDTKFVTSVAMLYRLLELAKDDYYVQSIDGSRRAHYYTMYFDTDDCQMYLAHQNGRVDRQKLRIRAYVDSQQSFLEVKTKDNHGRTRKKRVPLGAEISSDGATFEPLALRQREGVCDFLSTHLKYDSSSMVQQVENNFTRITLVNKKKTERLTIDTDLQFHNLVTGTDCSLGGLAIIELKRDGLVDSPILEMLRKLRIKPMGFSKYCMSQALTNPSLKRNNFKERLRIVSKMMKN